MSAPRLSLHAIVAALAMLLLAAGLRPGLARAAFGIASLTTNVSTTQAASHPDISAGFALNTEALGNPIEQLKNANVTLPPGIVGNPHAIERCSTRSFSQFNCPASSQVGILEASFIVCRGVSSPLIESVEPGATTVTVENTSGMCAFEPDNKMTIGSGATAEQVEIAYVESANILRLARPLQRAHVIGETVSHIAVAVPVPLPLFNLQPSFGHVATLGASLLFIDILVQVNVDSDGQLTATISEISTFLPITASKLTLWGVPAEASHDSQRCNQFGSECGSAYAQPAAFTTYSSDCSGPLQTEAIVESWQGQKDASQTTFPTPTGCEVLNLSPSLTVSPDTAERDSPAGYEMDLALPHEEQPEGIAAPDLRNVSVTLPAGTSLSPAMVNGLQACTDAQFEEEHCPNASKVGTAEVGTPLLADHLVGAVYIGTPTPAERYRMFVAVSADSVSLHLKAQIEASESDGQLTTTFRDLPQLPLSEFKLRFFGGPSAALANPTDCGPATTTSSIASYSGQLAHPSSVFTVTGTGAGGTCAPTSFAPGFSAGSTSALAGSFTPFALRAHREDGEPDFATIEAQLPAGLVGILQSVPPCLETQASGHTCPEASQIGTATVAAGAGPEPFYLTGPIYLTGPYDGAPFGMEITFDALAGPFDLGTIAVRAAINFDPADAHLTITSDPLPQILAGIPLRLRMVDLMIDRADFILNPTSCAPKEITASIVSADGESVALSEPFRVAGCTELPFAPRLLASVSTTNSRSYGTGLKLEIIDPSGTQAGLRSVVVDLPRTLVPRLATIQQACRAATLAVAPSACPAGSLVGTGTVHTPVLGSPLTGSVYLVAEGGDQLPRLVMTLRGEGVAVDLDGAIDVTGKGVTRTVFDALPDVPITSFELSLPSGPHSALGAIVDPCSRRPTISYALGGQNGASVKGATTAMVAGCARKRRVQSRRRK